MFDLESQRNRISVARRERLKDFFGPYGRAALKTGKYLYRGYRYLKPSHPFGAAVNAHLVQKAIDNYPSPPRTPRMSRSVSRGRKRLRSTSRARSRSVSRSRSSSIVSRQHDQRGVYRSRGGRGSGRRRGYTRFRYRVLNTLLNEQPMQIYTVKGANNLITTANKMGFYGVGLYQTQYTGQNDLYNIFTDAGISLATAAQKGMRVIIKGAVLDVEIKNNGTADIIMDVYELLNRKDVASTDTYTNQWASFFGMQGSITAAANDDPSNSVFENGAFCQHYKVLSKREVLIPSGDTITMQMRLSRDRRIQGESVLNYVNAIPKLSRLFFFMWHGPPEANAGSPQIGASDLTLTWQKVYKYGVPPTPKAQPAIHNT